MAGPPPGQRGRGRAPAPPRARGAGAGAGSAEAGAAEAGGGGGGGGGAARPVTPGGFLAEALEAGGGAGAGGGDLVTCNLHHRGIERIDSLSHLRNLRALDLSLTASGASKTSPRWGSSASSSSTGTA